ncbi:MAG: RdgB/HAM1 family non-canonical purine NTP pyrophosphatase [Bacteroidales bacterium]|jgi:XTP/dITP diphosphohydrolase|nr:RdgB/HAM1 family non-canonical purine NTP pyrophosphatase [Bacteroidales bacterium]
MQIIFATNNWHKVEEVMAKLSVFVPKDFYPYKNDALKIEILTLDDIHFHEEIKETGSTLEENALIKARAIWNFCRKPCFGDDTGLEIDALDGEPGVYSARYAAQNSADGNSTQVAQANTETTIKNETEENIFEKNIQKVLSKLSGIENRKARFRTVIAYIDSNGKEHLFEGIVDGKIIDEKHGSDGFGYDPIFIPDGYNITFAEMSLPEKNKISHRGKALDKFVAFFQNFM